MFVADIITFLDGLAPSALQEDYDNSGLLCGNPLADLKGVLVSLDVTEAIVEEAARTGCNLIVAHHPFIFKGLKKIQGKNWVERVLVSAIKNDISIFSIHTNLDNVLNGVNGRIADELELKNRRVLLPKKNVVSKLCVFVPVNFEDRVKSALFEAGAGAIGNYEDCSFTVQGFGTFKPNKDANPFIGKANEQHVQEESKIEMVFPTHLSALIVDALRSAHPYEEVAFDLFPLNNTFDNFGSGMIGELEAEIKQEKLLEILSGKFNPSGIRHSALSDKKIKKIGLCGGAGFFLLSNALMEKADVFITSDLKYHDFFEADGKILLVDIGHFESEQFTIDLLYDKLSQKFPTFAVRKTKIITNPVNYYQK